MHEHQAALHFELPAVDDEIRSAALQFVRKVSSLNKLSQPNEAAFHAVVDEITRATHNCFGRCIRRHAALASRPGEVPRARAHLSTSAGVQRLVCRRAPLRVAAALLDTMCCTVRGEDVARHGLPKRAGLRIVTLQSVWNWSVNPQVPGSSPGR